MIASSDEIYRIVISVHYGPAQGGQPLIRSAQKQPILMRPVRVHAGDIPDRGGEGVADQGVDVVARQLFEIVLHPGLRGGASPPARQART